MNFVLGLPRLLRGHDTIWVVVDRLKKFAHFIPIRLSYSTQYLGVIYIHEIVQLHRVLISIISNRDPCFTSISQKGIQSALGWDLRVSTTFHPQTNKQSECIIQILDDILRAYVLDFGGSSTFSGICGQQQLSNEHRYDTF